MKKIDIKKVGLPIVIVLLFLTLLLGFGLNKKYGFLSKLMNFNASNEVGNFTLTWIAGNTGETGTLDENGVLQVEPGENNIFNAESNYSGGAHVTYQLMFNMGGSEEAAPGAIKIKIPRYLFYGRDGKPLTDQSLDVPLVEAPEATGTGFNYQFITENDMDYILLTNYQVIPSSYSFECSITWILKTPSTVADGYKIDITGDVEVDLDGDALVDLHSKSNTLTMQYNSHAKINSLSESYYTHFDSYLKADTNVYNDWNNGWDASLKPENAEDYLYVVWYSSGYVYYATQPYSIKVTSEAVDEYGGEVIAYSKCSSSYTAGCFSGTSFGTDGVDYSVSILSSSSDKFRYSYFLVKYPKSALNDGKTHTLKNQAIAKLTGVDGAEDEKTATSSVNYTYVFRDPDVHEYGYGPTYKISMSKYGNKDYPGVINSFFKEEVGNDVSNTGYGNSYIYSPGSVHDYSSSGSATGTVFTLKDGEKTNPENLGFNSWKYVHEDDMMLLGHNDFGYEKLEYGDYEIVDFSFYDYYVYDYMDYEYSTNNGMDIYKGWQMKQDTDYVNYPPIKIYYKTDGDYKYYGEVNKTSSSGYSFKDEEGGVYPCSVYSSASAKPKLPKGTTGIKAIVETKKGQVSLNMYLNINLFNSQHVLDIMKDKDSVSLYNFNTVYIEDKDGEIYTDFVTSNNGRNLLSTFKTVVEDNDTKKYGKVMRHYFSDPSIYTRISGGTTKQNNWVNYKNDSGHRRINANYTAYAYEYRTYDKDVLSADDVIDLKIINEQRNGMFYNLLPIGMTVDTSTVVAQKFKVTSGSGLISNTSNVASTGDVVPSTVTLIDNYKDTGRIMMIVKVDLPEDDKNYASLSYDPGSIYYNYVYSGFTIRFTGYYSWDNIYDYGNNLTNSVAYKSGNGFLSNGYADDSSGLSSSYVDKDYLSDLDGDGNPDGTINDTVYAQRTMSFSFNTASDSSFHKDVIVSGMSEYGDGKDGSAVALAGGYYTYRLRYASQKNVSTRGLILYDVLENYEYDATKSWAGKLINIDLSQPKGKGIEPVVYYSTKKDINLYVNGKSTIDVPLPTDADITNASIWTTEAPSDLSTVTAIAIDLSKDKDGNEYVLKSEESVSVMLKMQAPSKGVETLISNNAKAKNAAWWTGHTKQLNEPEHLNLSVYEWTEVGIKNNIIDISKSSIIESGTQSHPTLVQMGDEIVYNIAVYNGNDFESLFNVLVNETLPSGIVPLFDDMRYYYDDNEESFKYIKDSTAITAVQNSNVIDFKVNQVLAGQVVHIIVPVIVNSEYETNILENVAVVEGYNEILYKKPSNPTYHMIEPIVNPDTGAFVMVLIISLILLIAVPLVFINKKKLFKV